MMATDQRQEAPAAPPQQPRLARGPLARWLAGWRISLRLARREIRRHRGRSLLVACMVGLPVLVMVGGLTTLATREISVAESVPSRMGSAQALIAGRSASYAVPGNPWGTDVVVECGSGGFSGYSAATFDGSWDVRGTPPSCGIDPAPAGVPPRAVPGLTAESSLAEGAAAIQRVTGGRLVPVSRLSTQVWPGTSSGSAPTAAALPVSVLGIDGADPAVRGMVDLTSGRWPTRPGEYVVTDAGQRLGLPGSGTLTLDELTPSGPAATPTGAATPTPTPTPTSTPTPAPTIADDRPGDPSPASTRVTGTIVGTASTARTDDPVGLVTVPPTQLPGTQFLLADVPAVTWDRVRELNSYGFVLLARDVVQRPDQVPPGLPSLTTQGWAVDLIGLSLLCVALLVESCLLAGPAFAVIAQRQRRSLALAASNGATRAQLRRSLLAQALVLGIAAALAGLVLGLVGVYIAQDVAARITLWRIGPFEMAPLESAIVAGFAIVAAVVSALIPARRLTRLDVVGALRGDVVSPRPHRGLPVLGAVLFVAGSLALVLLVTQSQWFLHKDGLAAGLVVLAGLALVVGALCLVPAVLALLGRLTTRLPIAVRLATRDAVRQRGRAIPTVAAIMAGAILLAGFGIAGSTMDEWGRRTYEPQAPEGMARIFAGSGSLGGAALREAVERAVPGARIYVSGRPWLPEGEKVPPASGQAEGGLRGATAAVVTTPSCDAATALRDMWPRPDVQGCPSFVIGSPGGSSGSAVVMSADDMATVYGLDEARRRVVREGGVLVSDPALITQGQLTVVRGLVDYDPQETTPTWRSQTATTTVPAMADRSLRSPSGGATLLITPQTAARLGIAAVASEYFVAAPSGGALTHDQEAALGSAIDGGVSGSVYVERGYDSPNRWVLLVMFLAVTVLILVATVTAVALSMGEARRDLATLAAVGAPDGIRRRLVAVQAGTLALVGTCLGLAVGAVPGAIYGWAVSRGGPDAADSGGYVVVPWLTLVAALVLVPLLAAGLAALLVRVRPDLTRRLS